MAPNRFLRRDLRSAAFRSHPSSLGALGVLAVPLSSAPRPRSPRPHQGAAVSDRRAHGTPTPDAASFLAASPHPGICRCQFAASPMALSSPTPTPRSAVPLKPCAASPERSTQIGFSITKAIQVNPRGPTPCSSKDALSSRARHLWSSCGIRSRLGCRSRAGLHGGLRSGDPATTLRPCPLRSAPNSLKPAARSSH